MKASKGIDARVRADGTVAYRARITGPDGKPIADTFDTRDEAEDWLTAIRRQVRDKKYTSPSTMTVGQCVALYLERGKSRWKGKTGENYRYNYERWIKPSWIANVLLSDLTLRKVQEWVDGIDGAPGSVRLAGVTLTASVKEAVRLGEIASNPAVGVRYPVNRTRVINPWNREEVQRIYKVVEGDVRMTAFYRLTLTTGLRSGELRALEWKDLSHGRLYIHRTVTVGDVIREGTKSGSGRVVSLPRSAIDALERWRLDAQGDLIFPSLRDASVVITGSTLANTHKRAAQEAGVKVIRLHDLRHTAATLMLQAGVPLKVVSEILGHASIAITGDVYQWVDEDMQRTALDRLDAWIG